MSSTKIFRVQREIYNRVPLPLVKMEIYPLQDLRLSQPALGRFIPGFVDPAVPMPTAAIPANKRIRVKSSRVKHRRPREDRTQPLNEPEIPGVPGSGRFGKDVRDKEKQDAHEKFHQMGDANTDPSEIAKLQQMVGGGGQVQQSAKQKVAAAIPDQMGWR